jgi:multiple sugar transport system permease protein
MAASTAALDEVRGSEIAATGSPGPRRRWALYSSYFFLILFCIFFLAPPVYMLITSLKTSQEIATQAGSPWLVINPTLANYTGLLTSPTFLTFFKNSFLVSVVTVAVTMVVSVLAAFSLARMRFLGSTILATGVFLTYLIPDTLLFIPMFKTFSFLREVTGIQFINKWWILCIIYPTLTVPFCTWILIGYFSSIPKELDEAAIVDGASYMQILVKVFLPVCLPGLIAATIFAFTVSWAQFLYPLAFTTTIDQLVLPVGIVTSLIKGDVFNWGQIMAGTLLGAAPPLLIYAFLMDYYIAGLTAGATKG